MSYTNATVIIAAADQEAAQIDFPGSFNSGFSETGEAPVTFYVCSGLWTDEDLSKVVNDVTWARKVYFGDVQSVLDSLNLKPVPPGEQSEPVPPGEQSEPDEQPVAAAE